MGSNLYTNIIILYMTSNGSLCSAFQFFSQETTTSILLSIPYVVGFSVHAQRCLLTISQKRFFPHGGKKILGSIYMASNGKDVQLFSFFLKKRSVFSSCQFPTQLGSQYALRGACYTIKAVPSVQWRKSQWVPTCIHIWPPMAVFVQPFSSFSKNEYFSPPLDSLHIWVLSLCSEVLAYYIGSFHTVEKNLVDSNMHI